MNHFEKMNQFSRNKRFTTTNDNLKIHILKMNVFLSIVSFGSFNVLNQKLSWKRRIWEATLESPTSHNLCLDLKMNFYPFSLRFHYKMSKLMNNFISATTFSIPNSFCLKSFENWIFDLISMLRLVDVFQWRPLNYLRLKQFTNN